MSTFGQGSIVQLPTGGPLMSVIEHYEIYERSPNDRGMVKCGWFDNENKYCTHTFPLNSVVWVE
jgi:uncharacterized protein YodC (DUF2158 family)